MIPAYNLNNLVNKPTCCQSNNPASIDLVLISRKNLFKLSNIFETGRSDHHELVSTILKSGTFKGTPKIRSFKKFNIENFNTILKKKLENLWNHSYCESEKVFLKELNTHAPLKKKIPRHNNNGIMTKELRQKIMLRSKLKNKFDEERNINWRNFKHQCYRCLKIYEKPKRDILMIWTLTH